MPRNLTIVLACLLALFLGWCKAWVTFGILAFLVAFLAFRMWWREKIIEPDNERLGMAVRAIRRVQEERSARSSEGSLYRMVSESWRRRSTSGVAEGWEPRKFTRDPELEKANARTLNRGITHFRRAGAHIFTYFDGPVCLN